MPSVPLSRLRADLQALYVPPSGAPATWKKIRQALDEFERLGCRRTSDLTPTAVARWLAARPGRAPATAYTLLSSLRRACTYARHMGWLKASPFAFRRLGDWVRDHDPSRPRDDDGPGGDDDGPARHHPIADLARAFTLLRSESPHAWENHRLFAVSATTYLTGARALEVQAAKAADFDLVRRLFSIRPNERRRLKTRASRRRVPIPAELAAILGAWLPLAASPWAFPGVTRVGPWTGGAPGRKPLDRLRRAGERAGVAGLTFLSLRHSYITHSVGWGVPDLVTRQIAGHTSRATTDGYRGRDPANLIAAVGPVTLGLAPPPGPASASA